MAYNYSKLNGRIVEVFSTRYAFASAMRLSERSICLKLAGKVPFKQPEITLACKLLNISDSEIPAYFFDLEVQKN